VRAEQVRLVFEGTLGASVSVVAVSGVAAWLVYASEHEVWILRWMALMVATPMVRLGLMLAYRRSTTQTTRASAWGHAFTAATALVGVAWSLAAFWLMPILPADEQVVMIVMLSGTMAAGVPVLAPLLASSIAYMTPPFAGLIYELVIAKGPIHPSACASPTRT
jgi:hypothetical protein